MVIPIGNNPTTPAINVSGTVTFTDSSKIQLNPDLEFFSGQTPTLLSILQAASGITTESSLTLNPPPLLGITYVPDNDATIEATVTPETPDQVADTIKQNGGGKSAQDTVKAFLDRILVGHSAVKEDVKKIYEHIAELPSGAAIANAGEELRVNNAGVTQEVNSALQTMAVTQVTRHINSTRLPSSIGASSSTRIPSSSGTSSTTTLPAPGNKKGANYGDNGSSHGLWMQALLADSSQKNRTNDQGGKLLGYDATSEGITLGYDQENEGLTLGGAVTFANTRVDKKDSRDHSELANYQVSLYGSWENEQWFSDVILNVGRSFHERTRFIDGANLDPIKSDFISNLYGLQVLSGMKYIYNDYYLQPTLGFSYSRIETPSYEEKSIGLTAKKQTYQRIELGLGLIASRSFELSSGILTPQIQLMGWHDFKNQQVETDLQFVSGPTFTSKGADPEKNNWQAIAMLSYQKNNNIEFLVGYEHMESSGSASNNYFMGVKYRY
ncbi:autotransporter outer membrane beta-barrel domain-containing protein [Endozoicomonas sp. Mp262]|uniref:autotransporter outer membrane beta-barrel domain-containing protein n=1 Tax=Endozoicomonas sp. Mp262 TaxID=2919499 RepID=UPI0021D84405